MSTPRPRPGSDTESEDASWRRAVRGLVLAWVALILLMLASLGSAWLPLGYGNAIAGIGIALVKVAIVVWFYMQFRRASAMTRIAGAAGVAMLVLLAALSGVDYATRILDPAPFQTPDQLPPLIQGQAPGSGPASR